MSEKRTIIILHESVLASWLKDVGSFGALVGLIYVNHTYGAGNGVVDGVGALLLLFYLISAAQVALGSAHRFTKDDLRRWALREEAP